ncbi:hypothetical protein HYH03_013700 [Edaphochlamys debaryana]|uniref:Ion transport domain-containing protein n=1 Tax=Edaphochlamys debaryana TaxID=47281 RepID=A0A835XT22_9CHLO|nr:hypothetical protein HYH03_013700 [Edaphochlamys debaryana]|eukprot:KAG2487701.1 hypothetical protein HYH03_013700 [Edaphochlamys debaryana]
MAEPERSTEGDTVVGLSADLVELMIDVLSPPDDSTVTRPDQRNRAEARVLALAYSDGGGSQDPGSGALGPTGTFSPGADKAAADGTPWSPPDVLATFGADPATDPGAALLETVLSGDEGRFNTVLNDLQTSAVPADLAVNRIFVAGDTAPASPLRRRMAKNLTGTCPSPVTKGRCPPSSALQPSPPKHVSVAVCDSPAKVSAASGSSEAPRASTDGWQHVAAALWRRLMWWLACLLPTCLLAACWWCWTPGRQPRRSDSLGGSESWYSEQLEEDDRNRMIDEAEEEEEEEDGVELYGRLRRHRYLRLACSPLSAAAALGHGDMVERLLAAGAQPDPLEAKALVEQGACWVSPLAAAALWGDIKIVRLLLSNSSGAEGARQRFAAESDGVCVFGGVTFTPLLVTPSWETAHVLLEAGAKRTLPEPIEPKRDDEASEDPSMPRIVITLGDPAPAATPGSEKPRGPAALLLAMIRRLAADDTQLVDTRTEEQPQQWQFFNRDGSQADLEALWRGCWLLHAADPRLAELWVGLGGEVIANAADLFGDLGFTSQAPGEQPPDVTLLEAAAAIQLAVDMSAAVRLGVGSDAARAAGVAYTRARRAGQAFSSPLLFEAPAGYAALPSIMSACIAAGAPGELLRHKWSNGQPQLLSRVWGAKHGERWWEGPRMYGEDSTAAKEGKTPSQESLLTAYLHLHGSHMPKIWGPWLPKTTLKELWVLWTDTLNAIPTLQDNFLLLQKAILVNPHALAAAALSGYISTVSLVSRSPKHFCWTAGVDLDSYLWVLTQLTSSRPAPEDGPLLDESDGDESSRINLGKLMMPSSTLQATVAQFFDTYEYKFTPFDIKWFISNYIKPMPNPPNSRASEVVACMLSSGPEDHLDDRLLGLTSTVLVVAPTYSASQVRAWARVFELTAEDRARAAREGIRKVEHDEQAERDQLAEREQQAEREQEAWVRVRKLVDRCLQLAAKPGAPVVHPEVAALLCRMVLVNQQADSQLMRDCLELLACGIRAAPLPAVDPDHAESQLRMLLADLAKTESGCLHLATLLSETGLGWSAADEERLPGGRLALATPCPKPPAALLPGGDPAVSAAALARINVLDELGDVASKPKWHQGRRSTAFGSALVDPLTPGAVTQLMEIRIALTQPLAYVHWMKQHFFVRGLAWGRAASKARDDGGCMLTLRAYLALRLTPTLWAAAAMATQGWTGVGLLCGLFYVAVCAYVALALLFYRTFLHAFMGIALKIVPKVTGEGFVAKCRRQMRRALKDPQAQPYAAVARRVMLPGVTSFFLDSFPKFLDRMLGSRRVPMHIWASPTLAALIMSHWSCFTQHVVFQMLVLRLAYTVVFIVYALSLTDGGDATPNDEGNSGGQAPADPPSHPCPSPHQHRLMVALTWMTAEYVVTEAREIWASGVLPWLRHPWNLFDAAQTGLMVATLSLHWSCGASLDKLRGLSQVLVLVLFWRLMQHASTSRGLGNFVRMVLEVTYDLRLFFVFLGMVYVGFGVALMVVAPNWGLMTESGEPVGRAKAVFLRLYAMLYGGDFGMDLLVDPGVTSEGVGTVTAIVCSLYMLFVTIILLNLLIAIIGDVYERVLMDAEPTDVRNKALAIAEIEQLMPKKLRRLRDKHLLKSKYLVVVQSEEVLGSHPNSQGDAGAFKDFDRDGDCDDGKSSCGAPAFYAASRFSNAAAATPFVRGGVGANVGNGVHGRTMAALQAMEARLAAQMGQLRADMQRLGGAGGGAGTGGGRTGGGSGSPDCGLI